jgi:hypothetical protein
MRGEELDAALKSGNIERIGVNRIDKTGGVGRAEHRRKLLTMEWSGLREQANLLEEGRSGIQSALAAAERVA